MRKIKSILTVFILVSLTDVCLAVDVEQATPEIESYEHQGKQYPPVLFVTNVTETDVKEKLEAYKVFKRLDTESIGLPIGVRVLKGYRRKQDAALLSTVMLSASTLGIIPVVSNAEFKVHYDVFVQGKSIAKFKYQIDSTDVDNFWKGPNAERETKPSEELFIEHTLTKFLTELKDNQEVQAAFSEYWDYFDEES